MNAALGEGAGELLTRDPAWRPPPDVRAAWEARAAAGDGADPAQAELRWWRAWDAAKAGDWDTVTALAEQGLGEPFSEREVTRLALLHAVSGALEEAEHVIAQAVQHSVDEGLPRRFAALCAREGLAEAARRFGL